ncbi:Atg21 [Kluyveromyces lactis]|nr:Atg21 [Kluyveromyces lactis]
MALKLLGFNQDATCFSVISSNKGVTIYNCDPFGKCFELEKSTSNDEELDFLVEMLFSTSLIAVVDKTIGASKRKKLKIVNTKRKATICELTFPHEIMDVIMNRKIICVVLKSDQIFVYDISCMKLLRTIDVRGEKLKSTSKFRNSEAVGDLGVRVSLSTDNNSILCYSSYSKSDKENAPLNDIVVFDALKCIQINVLPTVHQSNIVCIACSPDGMLVATASEKGTIIRVFKTIDTENDEPILVNEFRRGSRPSRISEMKFNHDNTLLACVGESDTIHIFALPVTTTEADGNADDTLQQSSHSLSSSINGLQYISKGLANRFGKIVVSKIPTQSQQRHVAYIKIPENAKYRIGFPKDTANTIHICGEDGNYLVYSIPRNEVGPCTLVKSNTFD